MQFFGTGLTVPILLIKLWQRSVRDNPQRAELFFAVRRNNNSLDRSYFQDGFTSESRDRGIGKGVDKFLIPSKAIEAARGPVRFEGGQVAGGGQPRRPTVTLYVTPMQQLLRQFHSIINISS